MTRTELIKLASSGYPDDLIYDMCWNKAKDKPRLTNSGDGLARFIAIELNDTFDQDLSDEHQRLEAIRVLTTAQRELGSVISALTKGYS